MFFFFFEHKKKYIYIYIYIKKQFSDLQIVLNNINQFQINFSRWTLLENLLLFTYWFYFKQTFLADQSFRCFKSCAILPKTNIGKIVGTKVFQENAVKFSEYKWPIFAFIEYDYGGV